MRDSVLAMFGDAPNAEALRTLARVRRDYAERIVEALIDAFDAEDGEPDLEEDADDDPLALAEDDDADREPSLGAPDGNLCQPLWAQGAEDDRECDSACESSSLMGAPHG